MKKTYLLLILLLFPLHQVFSQLCAQNIQDFGAIGDGVTLCTKSIQKAIDRCGEQNGGKVLVPPGKYLTGPLFLTSNITFELLSGAVLVFDDNITDCPIVDGRWEGIERKVYASLFTGHQLENVSIVGRGKIDGQGKKWWKAHKENRRMRNALGLEEREQDNPPESPLKVPRPRLVNLYNCDNVLISELTFVNSPSWTIHPVYCTNVTIEKISIIQPHNSPNTDGINPESCRNVRILNCFVDCGDDCITIKSGYNEDGRRVGIPCENIVISNCTFAHGHSAIGIGSEMSGGIKNVAISNCVFNGTKRGIRIKTTRGRGGIVENIRADNIVMNHVEVGISLNMHYRGRDRTVYPVTVETPYLKNIHLSNITAVNLKDAVTIIGLPEAPIVDLSITNSNFSAKNGFDIEYVENMDIRDVSLNCETGDALKINTGKDIVIDNFECGTVLEDQAVIELQNASDVFIYNCRVNPGSDVFLRYSMTKNLNFGDNWLGTAQVIDEDL
jgi:polygalacturonase